MLGVEGVLDLLLTEGMVAYGEIHPRHGSEHRYHRVIKHLGIGFAEVTIVT